MFRNKAHAINNIFQRDITKDWICFIVTVFRMINIFSKLKVKLWKKTNYLISPVKLIFFLLCISYFYFKKLRVNHFLTLYEIIYIFKWERNFAISKSLYAKTILQKTKIFFLELCFYVLSLSWSFQLFGIFIRKQKNYSPKHLLLFVVLFVYQ